MEKLSIMRKAVSLLSYVGIIFCCTAAVFPIVVQAQTKDPLQTSISIEANKQPLEKLLTQIAATTNVKLAYDVNQVGKYTVTLREKKDITVEDLLKKVLQQTNLTFESQSNTIVIYEKGKEGAAVNTPVHQGDMVSNIAYRTQIYVIEGAVLDDNGPLPNASVYIKGTNKGTVTNEKGIFSLESNDKEVDVTVSVVGYHSKTARIKTGEANVIVLQKSVNQMDSVVVVGYGTQRRRDLTTAVTIVSLEDNKNRSIKSATEALQGKAAGVTVMNEGGDPTAGPWLQIRGLGGGGALWVVDGVIGGTLPNPNDIESIAVLKDASAAIYGSRASGGVITVTTKKGKAGKTSINANVKQGWQKAWRLLQPLNAADYVSVVKEADKVAGISLDPTFTDPYYSVSRTNWMNAVFRTGKMFDANVDVRGGSEKASFFTSFNYRNDQGILLNTYSKRYAFRINSDYKITDWLKIGENVTWEQHNGRGTNTTSQRYGVIKGAFNYPSSAPIYNSDGTFGGVSDEAHAGSFGDLINPVAQLLRADDDYPSSTFFINPYVEIKFTPWLSFKSHMAFNKYATQQKNFTSKILEPGKKFYQNSLWRYSLESSNMLAEQILTFDKRFNQAHHVSATLAYAYEAYRNEYFSTTLFDFESEEPAYRYWNMAQTFDQQKPDDGKWEERTLSYVGRVNYDYKGKYLFSASMRRDGTSKLRKNNRWENYPSLSAGWRISDEPFMDNINWLTSLKLRGSWGKMGNVQELDGYATYIPMGTVDYNTEHPTTLGDPWKLYYGWYAKGIENPNLKWEYVEMTDIGFDMDLFKTFNLSFDWFQKDIKRGLMSIPLPPTAGVTEWYRINGPASRNKGIELTLSYSNKKREFKYDLSASLATIKNKILKFDGDITFMQSGGFPDAMMTSPMYNVVGYPKNSFFGLKTNGIFQSDAEAEAYKNKNGDRYQRDAKAGDLRYVDVNGDGKIDNSFGNDRVYLGDAFPDYTFGLTANFTYKDFDASIFLQGVTGMQNFNSLKSVGFNAANQGYNLLADVKNAWSPTNTGSSIPRISAKDLNGNFSTPSDFFVEKGDYMRIKNFTLGYTLPKKYADKCKLSNLRVYASGQNLLTITKYTGFDPEVGNAGLDAGRYPVSRIFMLGLSVGL